MKANSSQIEIHSYERDWGSVCVLEQIDVSKSLRFDPILTASVREPLSNSVFKAGSKKKVAVRDS